MRSFLVSSVVLLMLSAGASLPAAAGASDHVRDEIIRDRSESARWSDDYKGARTQRRRLARSTYSDAYDEPELRPRRSRSYDAGARQHRRYTKRTRARTAKHAKRRHHVARRHGATKRMAVRRPPAWNRRSLSTAGPSGSGTTGIASYYWQGQKTATGARYNPDGISAAHRTLPFGTRVRVTHLGNGRAVDLRINDRGPYIGGRIIDLSRGAAKVIGMTGQGLARVKVVVLGRK